MAWGFKATITIDETKCGTANSTDYPALISDTYDGTASEPDLRHTTHGGDVTDVNGYDICFYSDSNLTTQLDHEIESYNHETGAVNFWVRIPTLDTSANTVIYMAYGDSGITTSQEDITGVWDTYYKAVWHFHNFLDSTQNNHDLTNTDSTSDASGAVGAGRAFAGNQYLTAGDSNDFAFGANDFTLEAWAKFTNFTTYRAIWGQATDASHLQWMFGTDGSKAGFDSDTLAGNLIGGTNMSTGVWNYIYVTRTGASYAVYLNGNTTADDTATRAGDTSNMTGDLTIGRLTSYTIFDMVGSNWMLK